MKIIIFGAGNVGRGFIGQLSYESGYETIFFDVNQEVIDEINKSHSYPHITVSNEQELRTDIKNVRAINSADEKTLCHEVNEAVLIATAVGARALAFVAKSIALGLKHRFSATPKVGTKLPTYKADDLSLNNKEEKTGEHDKAVNILLCENIHNVASIMRSYLIEYMPEYSEAFIDRNIGFLTTSIGKMIPAIDVHAGEHSIASIQVEPYKFLPFDAKAIRGKFPEIKGLVPAEPFEFYADRKLYVHNMGHCVTAYMANIFGYEYIWEAINNSKIRYIVRAVMIESALALNEVYDCSIEALIEHIDDLIYRFGNRALQDTAERVGRDHRRKLARQDRFLGAYELALRAGTSTAYLSFAVALAMYEFSKLENEEELKEFMSLQEFLPCLDEQYEQERAIIRYHYKQLHEGFDFAKIIEIISEKYRGAKVI